MENEEPEIKTYADALKWAKDNDPKLYEEMRKPLVNALLQYAKEMVENA